MTPKREALDPRLELLRLLGAGHDMRLGASILAERAPHEHG